MDIISIVNTMQPNTIAKLALTQDALPDGTPFMGAYVTLFDGARLPAEADVTAYEPTYTASILQQSLLAGLASHRYSVLNGGTIINGIPFKTDPESRSDLMAIYIIANANSGFSTAWKADDGNFYPLTASQIVATGNAILGFVQKCFATEHTLKTNIANYTDIPTIIAAFDAGMAA